ncbi:MAG TPA: 2'-5' RNA ligase family protein [Flavisolibacter sp.]|nr:2'-5' RNA ligase family protein [Flavisolibacter sp.]
MEPINFHMPGYRINEYLLVLNPPEDLWQKIMKIKEGFAEKYKNEIAKFTKPHITLINWVSLELVEERMMQRLQNIAMGITPFKVELKDYGSFPSHTIFINVVSKLPIQSLVREMKQAQRLMTLNRENKPHFIETPHISICRKLKPWQYEEGWLEFSNRQFTGRFIADSMLLLKRPAGQKVKFQIAKRMEFQNLPVTTKQGNLFI